MRISRVLKNLVIPIKPKIIHIRQVSNISPVSMKIGIPGY